MGVHVPQDGDRLHGVRVPDTDVRVLPHLTCRHLDLIRMHGQTEKGRRRSQQRPTAELDFLSPHCDLITRADLAAADEAFNRSAATRPSVKGGGHATAHTCVHQHASGLVEVST